MSRSAVIFLAAALSVVLNYAKADESVTRSFSQSLLKEMSLQEVSIKNRLQAPVSKIYLELINDLPELINTTVPIDKVRILPNNVLVINIDIKNYRVVSNLSIDTFAQNVTSLVDTIFYGQNIGQGGVICMFDGNVSEYFYAVRKTEVLDEVKTPLQAQRVVFSAAHGIYYNYGSNSWQFQRQYMNQIREDTLTPLYASTTAKYLKERSGIIPYYVRSIGGGIHAPSGRPWGQMAARYWLQHRLPAKPEVWNSYSPRFPTDPKREENDDINARPLYANYIAASGLFSLHTNGNILPLWKGFRVIHHPDRPVDRRLAQNIDCYMRELKTSVEKYKDFKQLQIRASTDYGEINLAQSRTVIVEPGYHSNASDAAALRDPEFRTIVGKAIEKGWRLTNEDKPCALFNIASVPKSTGNHNTPIPVNVNYKGYPQFPLKVEVTIFQCPAGWSCNGGVLNVPDNRPSPISYTFRCNAPANKPAAIFGVETRMTDADNVATKRVKHFVVCRPTSSLPVISASEGFPSGIASIH